jgi:hypothetical protein
VVVAVGTGSNEMRVAGDQKSDLFKCRKPTRHSGIEALSGEIEISFVLEISKNGCELEELSGS